MNIKKEKYCDVFIAGGGVAGCAAAVQAARCGKKVLLADKCVQLGGLATTGLVNFFEPLCNGRGVKVIGGLAEEFLWRAVQYGYDDLPSVWWDGEPGYGQTTSRMLSHFSAPIFALVLCELLQNEGVELMFDTVVTDVEQENGHITSAVVFNKSGYWRIHAKIFVDTSGDADLLHYAGVPTCTQGNYHTYAGWGLDLEHCAQAVQKQDVAKLYFDIPGGNAGLGGRGHPEGLPLWDGTDSEQVTAYLKMNQVELLNNIKADNRKSRDIVMLPGMCQFRTTRRIDGNATLTVEDMYQHSPNSVGVINDFTRRDALFEVPYGALVKDGFDNIITAGRCASAKDRAWDAIRVIPPAIFTGQVAGMAASHAIDEDCAISQVQIASLQKALSEAGIMIHFDDAWIPEDNKS